MSILQFGNQPRLGRKLPKKSFMALGVMAAFAMVASTLASNININTGPVEFGQGITQTTSCSGDQDLAITPRADFENASQSGTFIFSSITVSNIPETCSGKDFIFGFYGETSTAKLNLDSRGSQTTPYVYFTVADGVGNAAAFTKPPSNGAFRTTNVTASSFTLVFAHPDASADQLYKITIETRDNVGGATSLGGNDGQIQITSPQTYVNAALVANSIDKLAVSGFTHDVRVVISIACGLLSFEDTTGLSPVYGYQDPIDDWAPEVGILGSVTNINNALDSLLYDSTDCTGSLELDTTVSDTGVTSDDSIAFNPENGHYYKYVTGVYTWLEAFNEITGSNVVDDTIDETNGGNYWTRDGFSFENINLGRTSCAYSFNGLCGYFATVTTASENAYINLKVGQEQVWLGGSDRVAAGEWRWADDRAPEYGRKFANYEYSTGPDNFAPWNSGEPNCYDQCTDYMLNEPALQMLAGDNGLWNNFTESGFIGNDMDQRMGYIVEFGDSSADNAVTYIPVTRTITFQINP